MVAKDGGYYGTPLEGYCGVTQTDPLSPKIINVLVDAAIIHWLMVLSAREMGAEGLGTSV